MIYIDKCERIFPRKITCVLMEIHMDTSGDNSKRLPESDINEEKNEKKIMSCDMQTTCYSCPMYVCVCLCVYFFAAFLVCRFAVLIFLFPHFAEHAQIHPHRFCDVIVLI